MYRLSASQWDSFDAMFDDDKWWATEESFIDRLQGKYDPPGEAQLLGQQLHSAIERFILGERDGMGKDQARNWRCFSVPAIEALAGALPPAHALDVEIKHEVSIGRIHVPLIADVLAPGLFAADWKTSKNPQNLTLDRWIDSWQWRLTCHAMGVQEFIYLGVLIKNPNVDPIVPELCERYTATAYHGMEDDLVSKAYEIARWIDERNIAIEPFEQRFRYGRA